MYTVDTRELGTELEELQERRNCTAANDCCYEGILDDGETCGHEELSEDEQDRFEDLLNVQAIMGERWPRATLIHEDSFEDYAREYAEDLHSEPSMWPFTCINWEKAARDLRQDFTLVTISGLHYYYR